MVALRVDTHVFGRAGRCPTLRATARGGRSALIVFEETKDQAMVDDAAYGLMLWDGESKGTVNSVICDTSNPKGSPGLSIRTCWSQK